MRRALALVLALSLSGCGSLTVLGGCEIPHRLDYIAKGPEQLPEKTTTPADVIRDDVIQRSERRVLADDYNALTSFVKENCQ